MKAQVKASFNYYSHPRCSYHPNHTNRPSKWSEWTISLVLNPRNRAYAATRRLLPVILLIPTIPIVLVPGMCGSSLVLTPNRAYAQHDAHRGHRGPLVGAPPHPPEGRLAYHCRNLRRASISSAGVRVLPTDLDVGPFRCQEGPGGSAVPLPTAPAGPAARASASSWRRSTSSTGTSAGQGGHDPRGRAYRRGRDAEH